MLNKTAVSHSNFNDAHLQAEYASDKNDISSLRHLKANSCGAFQEALRTELMHPSRSFSLKVLWLTVLSALLHQ